MTVNARSWSSLVQDHPLAWEPVWTELMKDREAARFCWRRIQYVFGLSDPRLMAQFEHPFSDDEREVLERFVQQARDLAGSTFLSAKDEVTISIADDGMSEAIEKRLSDRDVTVGFMVMFRQCYSNDEKASFKNARGIVMQRAKNLPEGDDRSATLRAWAKTQGQMRGRLLESHVHSAMADRGDGPAMLKRPDGDPQHPDRVESPEMLLSTYWYGDMIHWTRGETTLIEWEKDAFTSAWKIIHTLMAASELAHFYVGFGGVVARLLGQPPESL